MSIPETQALKRSQTNSFALPNISKTQARMKNYRTAGANTTRHHSVFLDKIKDMTKNVRYEEMETTNINEQQKQLKSLLRQFNKETYSILSRYIDRPVQVKSSKKPRATSTSMMEIKDKQISNSNDALEICKREMQALQRKCQNLKYVTVEQFQRKIDSIKKQIEGLIVQNKQIIKGNTLRGLTMKRGESKNYSEVSQIQQQKFIWQKKKQKLIEQSKIVNDQQQKLKQNHNKADEQIKKLSEEFNKYEKQFKEGKQQKQLNRIYQQKKKQYGLRRQKLDIKNQRTQKQSTTSQQSQKNQKNQIMTDNKAQIKSQGFEIKPNQAQMRQKQIKQDQAAGLSVIASVLITENKKQKNQVNKQKTQVNKQKSQAKQKVQGGKTINNSKYQQQYLKLLKQLDDALKSAQKYQQTSNQLTIKVQLSRKEILLYQHKLSTSKKPANQTPKNTSQANDKNKQQQVQARKTQEKKVQQNKKWSLF